MLICSSGSAVPEKPSQFRSTRGGMFSSTNQSNASEVNFKTCYCSLTFCTCHGAVCTAVVQTAAPDVHASSKEKTFMDYGCEIKGPFSWLSLVYNYLQPWALYISTGSESTSTELPCWRAKGAQNGQTSRERFNVSQFLQEYGSTTQW